VDPLNGDQDDPDDPVDPLNGDQDDPVVDPLEPLNGDQDDPLNGDDDVLEGPSGPNGVAILFVAALTVCFAAWKPFDKYVPTNFNSFAISLFYLFFLFDLTHEIIHSAKH